MAISRCNQCGRISEHQQGLIGSQHSCERCGIAAPIYDTVFFITKLSELYFTQRKELNKLRALSNESQTEAGTARSAEDFDIHNTSRLSDDSQHSPIIEWFKAKGITAIANVEAVDTTGFFDEAAVSIGSDYPLLGEVCERIRYAQLKEFSSNLIQLDKKSKEEVKAIETFIHSLYNHSLIARYIPNKKEKNIRVVLQNAPTVRRFFAGDWLEWYALMIVLRVLKEKNVKFACARNMTLSFLSKDNRELDVFFLINKTQPLYIECKTGDFRSELSKYVGLRKRLAIEQRFFVLCVADLDSEQAKGLSAMYGLTFVNTQTLGPHILTLV